MLTTGHLAEASNLMPTTIKGAMSMPVVCDLIKSVGKPAVSRLIEFELAKLSAAVSVGGNLDNYKVQLIATQLIEFFPNESIADFKVCFFRASAGQYGDIFRLDGIIVRKFMEAYLDEKYQTVEEQLMKEKDNLYKAPEKGKSDFNVYEEFLRVHGTSVGNKIPSISREEILRNGQSEPPKKPSTGHRPMSPEEVEAWHAEKAKNLAAAKERRLAELREKHPTLGMDELNRLL